MDILYRNAIPSYRGSRVQPQPTGGFFSGVLGAQTPNYRTVDGRRVSVQPSASWWQALFAGPSYRTVPRAAEPTEPAQEVVQHCDVAVVNIDDTDPEQTCVCAPEDATQIVILE